MLVSLGSRVSVKKKPFVAYATSGNGLTISTAFFTADQRNSPKKKLLIVPAGVTLGAPVTGVMNGKLEIWVLGNVDGLGGVGSTVAGTPGGNGGDAIRCDMDGVTIRVKGGGNLRGGGGGGGKGGQGYTTQGPLYSTSPASYYGNDPGGNFVYWQYNVGGSENDLIYNSVPATQYGPDAYGWTYFRGTYVTNFGSFAAYTIYRTKPNGAPGNGGKGAGYDGAVTNGVAGTGASGAGGNGGDFGVAGSAGAVSGAAGGSPGKAANFNGKLGCSVVADGGTILGIAA